jgi:hypothetical protein
MEVGILGLDGIADKMLEDRLPFLF